MDGENNGKPYLNGWFGGTTILGNIHMFISIIISIASYLSSVNFFDLSSIINVMLFLIVVFIINHHPSSVIRHPSSIIHHPSSVINHDDDWTWLSKPISRHPKLPQPQQRYTLLAKMPQTSVRISIRNCANTTIESESIANFCGTWYCFFSMKTKVHKFQ